MPLPVQAQFSMINSMEVGDFNGDGNLDVVLNGNDYGTEVFTGRYDALNGLLLVGNGKGQFESQSILQSGIYIPGNGKAMVGLKSASGKYLLAASQNRGPLKIFELKRKTIHIPLHSLDVTAIIRYKTGKVEKRECYYGNSFLSQSGRFLLVDNQVVSVEITDSRGQVRKESLIH